MSDFWIYSVLIGVVIVLALAVYAGKLLKQLTQQKKQQAQGREKKKVKCWPIIVIGRIKPMILKKFLKIVIFLYFS